MNTWTNLLSGFLGAIVGGLITLLATWLTIRQERALAREAAAEDRRRFTDARSQGAARELMTLALGPLQDVIEFSGHSVGDSPNQHNPLPGLASSMNLTLIPLVANNALRSRLTRLLDFLADLDRLRKMDGIEVKYLQGACQNASAYLTYVTGSLSAYLADQDLPPQQEPSRHLLTVLENLDTGTLDARLSSIHTLEDIANELDDWATVQYILARYVTNRAPWPPSLPWQPPLDEPIGSVSLNSWAPDVQSALSVLGRRNPTRSGANTYYKNLYLWRADLRGADLSNAKLEEVTLEGSNLQAADLRGANLSDAKFKRTELQGAIASLTTVWPKEFEPRNYEVVIEAE
jgi:hypothetical protein